MHSSLFYTPQTLQTAWADRVAPSLYEQLESWHVHSWLPSVHKGDDVTHKVLVPMADLLGSLHWGMSCFLPVCMIEWPFSYNSCFPAARASGTHGSDMAGMGTEMKPRLQRRYCLKRTRVCSRRYVRRVYCTYRTEVRTQQTVTTPMTPID